MSNLTNLLAFSAAGLSFLHFTAVMALPWLAVVAIEFLILRGVFAKDLAVAPRLRTDATPAPWPRFTLVVLALTLAGFALTSLAGLSPAWAALAGALVLGIRGLATGRTTVTRITVAADGPFLVFVLCLGVVVDAVMRNGLESTMQQILPDGTGLPALLWIAAVAAMLSNVVNNLPAVLVLLPLVAAMGPPAVLAMLIGVNVGPNLTYVGSLANLLWRNVVRTSDVPTGAVAFSFVGLCTVPLTLVAGVAALWAGLQLFNI